MDDFHRRLCQETGALLSPVGTVWQAVLAEDPEFPLYFQDGEHASPYGDYLVAVTHYRLLSGKPALGLPNIGCDFFDPGSNAIREDPESGNILLDEEKCRRIQRAADRVLAPFPR